MSHLSLDLKMTIISQMASQQKICKEALEGFVKASIDSKEMLQIETLKIWTQPDVDALCRYCSHQDVIIEMNITIGYLRLSGRKESVSEAENEYLRQDAKQHERARLAAIDPRIIWAYQIDENKWEKYKPELNIRIECAYASKILTVSVNGE